MKIIQLHAENYKRLRTVEIAPDGNIVTVGGRNGRLKSTTRPGTNDPATTATGAALMVDGLAMIDGSAYKADARLR